MLSKYRKIYPYDFQDNLMSYKLKEELKELLLKESSVSLDFMRRRIRSNLFIKCDLGTVRKSEKMKVAVYRIVPVSYNSLTDVDITLHDAALFIDKMPAPNILDHMYSIIKAEIEGKETQSDFGLKGAIGVIWWDAKNVFYSIFNPNAEVLDQCYCIKGEELVSILMQARCLNRVFSGSGHFERLRDIISGDYNNQVRRSDLSTSIRVQCLKYSTGVTSL